jgi:hypothetical protein
LEGVDHFIIKTGVKTDCNNYTDISLVPTTHTILPTSCCLGKLHIHIKGKAIPLQALTGPEGSRRFRLADFKTIGT